MLKGIIVVQTSDIGFERVVNICKANKIRIWKIQSIENGKIFEMNAKDFKMLLPVARKTGCKFKIIKKCGIPFFIFRYRKHYCFIIGLAISCLIMYLSTLFIWEIDFDGNVELTDNVLQKYLSSIGVNVGMKLDKFNCGLLEEQLRKSFSNITWASVELTGTKITVHIKENTGIIGEKAVNGNGDLIANYNGEIVSIITRKGTPRVKSGDVVSSTDVLVNGEVFVYNDNKEIVGSYKVDADADVMIKTVLLYQDYVDAGYEYKLYTGNDNNCFEVSVLGKSIAISNPFIHYQYCDELTDISQLKLNNSFTLPITVSKKQQIEYISEFGIYTEEQAKAILMDNLSKYLEKLVKKGVQILDTSVTIDYDFDKNYNRYSCAGEIKVICPVTTKEVIDERN